MARMSPTARSVFAVIDGLLLFFALEGAFYAVAFLGLHRSFDTPTHLYLSCNLLWALVSALVAGYATGRVARRHAVAHGVGLAVPFLVLSVFNLNKGIGGRHTLYVIGINLLVPIGFVVGSFLAVRRHGAPRARLSAQR